MKKFTYSLFPPKNFILSYKKHRHTIFEKETLTYIVPEKLNELCLNPRSVSNLTEDLSIKEILILDRVINLEHEVCIVGHVNRSGTNFLIGNTPYNKHPQFPDMSNIYTPIKGLDKIVVHTVGIERFSSFKGSNHYISEAVGLIAPVWHYVGVKVSSKTHIKKVLNEVPFSRLNSSSNLSLF